VKCVHKGEMECIQSILEMWSCNKHGYIHRSAGVHLHRNSYFYKKSLFEMLSDLWRPANDVYLMA
jgi:hypothetical protein